MHYGDIGNGYETVFKAYLKGAEEVILEDAYFRAKHQISNFLRFAELVIKVGDCKKLTLITNSDDGI